MDTLKQTIIITNLIIITIMKIIIVKLKYNLDKILEK